MKNEAMLFIYIPSVSDSIDKIKLSDICTIGRKTGNSKANIQLDSPIVSRLHGEFALKKGEYYYTDSNSLNGTFVNNVLYAKKANNSTVKLKNGDVLRIDKSSGTGSHLNSVIINFVQNDSGEPALSEKQLTETIAETNLSRTMVIKHSTGSVLSIRIDERSVWQRLKKVTLLRNINMTIACGEMVMILGGSGAGKTTFMNAVMGYEKADGEIFHGDKDIYNDYEEMKYEIGYVPQQDLLRGSDTVFDTLNNAAEMKMPRTTTSGQKEQRIKEVLGLLGLEREQKSLVSKLSGGQRKRLSIAVEYIADPLLFFLDEPDSGLDGIMARSLNENLRTIANSGKIVMVITHSPDRVAKLYNKIIVLAKSTKDNCGYLAYYGSVSDALTFFETNSLEGVVKRINRPDEGGDGKADFYINKYASITD